MAQSQHRMYVPSPFHSPAALNELTRQLCQISPKVNVGCTLTFWWRPLEGVRFPELPEKEPELCEESEPFEEQEPCEEPPPFDRNTDPCKGDLNGSLNRSSSESSLVVPALFTSRPFFCRFAPWLSSSAGRVFLATHDSASSWRSGPLAFSLPVLRDFDETFPVNHHS